MPSFFNDDEEGGTLYPDFLGRLFGLAPGATAGATGSAASPAFISPAQPDLRSALIARVLAGQHQPRKRRPIDYLMDVALPLGQGFAAAAGARPFEKGRAFWSTLLSQGTESLGREVYRPELERQRAEQDFLGRAALVARLMGPPRAAQRRNLIQAQDPNDPTKTIFIDEQTGEPVSGLRPPPKEAGTPHERERVLPTGESVLERLSPATGEYETVTRKEEPSTRLGAAPVAGTLVKPRVPFVTKPKPEAKKPRITTKVDKAGNLRAIDEDTGKQLWSLPGFGSESESDESRAIKRQVSAAAVAALKDADDLLARQRAGKPVAAHEPRAAAEQRLNKALELFEAAARKNETLREHAPEISQAIRAIGRRATTNEVLQQILERVLAQPPEGQ